jgi:hypothetical protein
MLTGSHVFQHVPHIETILLAVAHAVKSGAWIECHVICLFETVVGKLWHAEQLSERKTRNTNMGLFHSGPYCYLL